MQRVPFALEQARSIRQQHLFLIGHTLNDGDIIEDVVVAPFDIINQKKFLLYFMLFNDAEQALMQEYKGLLYDVIVLTRTNDGEQIHESLDLWLDKNYVSNKTVYDIPVAVPLLSGIRRL